MKRAGIHLMAKATVLFTVLLSAMPAMAQEHDTGSKMLPALDASLFPGVLFWMISGFAVFFLVMQFIGVPGIQKTITRRQDILSKDLGAAREASERAQAVVKAYEAELQEARVQAHKTVSQIVTEAQKVLQTKMDAQAKETKHRLSVAQQNIAETRKTAMQESKPFINDLVEQIYDKVMQSGVGLQTNVTRK